MPKRGPLALTRSTAQDLSACFWPRQSPTPFAPHPLSPFSRPLRKLIVEPARLCAEPVKWCVSPLQMGVCLCVCVCQNKGTHTRGGFTLVSRSSHAQKGYPQKKTGPNGKRADGSHVAETGRQHCKERNMLRVEVQAFFQ